MFTKKGVAAVRAGITRRLVPCLAVKALPTLHNGHGPDSNRKPDIFPRIAPHVEAR